MVKSWGYATAWCFTHIVDTRLMVGPTQTVYVLPLLLLLLSGVWLNENKRLSTASIMPMSDLRDHVYGIQNITSPVLAPKKICVYIIYAKKKSFCVYAYCVLVYTGC